MDFIYQEIRRLGKVQGLSKHEQFVDGILNVLRKKELKKGDRLPSVNEFVKELGFAKETIMNAYKDLIDKGIVESRNRIGFYIIEEDIQKYLKIALVLFAFDTIQETFCKTFRDKLDGEARIDVYFHHNNIRFFESIIFSIVGKYNVYIVTPISNERTASILKKIPLDRCLLIDRFESIKTDFSYVVQEIEQSLYGVFKQLKPRICKYKNGMVYFHRPLSNTSEEALNAFKKFVWTYKIEHEIFEQYRPGSIKKDRVYFAVNNTELWMMLKDAKDKNFILGKDIGILSYNDDIAKEIIFGGITTYSADFRLMGEYAGRFVLTGQKIREIIPVTLVDRKSV